MSDHDNRLEKLGAALKLGEIVDKSKTVDFCQSLSNDARGLIVVEEPCACENCRDLPDGERQTTYRCRWIGDTDDRDALYIMRMIESAMFDGN
jgi:hypothetical protein